MNNINAREIEEKMEVPIYPKRGIVVERASGVRIWDANGKEYLDFGASYGVCNSGHCNPEVNDAIKVQMEKIIFIQGTYTNQVRSELIEKLCQITGLDRVFLCNSGTETVEAAIKFARASTGRKKIIAAMRGFHGRTMGALSATHKAKYREPFLPLVPGFTHVPFDNIEKMREAVGADTAAVILEPVQGEGGVRVPSIEFLRGVRKICDDAGALLVLDEVQTGMCRTGKFFAFEHFGIEPDILCIAKSLGNGYPIGAVLFKEKAAQLPVLSHGTAFGGAPLACAAALANLNFMEREKLWERADRLGKYFLDELRKIKSGKIREVRGMGLMIGVELKEKSGQYLEKLVDGGILALPAGSTVIRFLPPLVVEKEDIDIAVKTLGEILE